MSTPRSIFEAFQLAWTNDFSDVEDFVADDVVWELNGSRETSSREAFVERQRADLGTGSAETVFEQVAETPAGVLAVGVTVFTPHQGDPARMRIFQFLEVEDDLVVRIVDTFAPLAT